MLTGVYKESLEWTLIKLLFATRNACIAVSKEVLTYSLPVC